MTSQTKFKSLLVALVALLVLGGGGLYAAYVFMPNWFGGNVNTNVVNQNNNTNVVNQNTNGGVVNQNVVIGNLNTNQPSGQPLSDENRILALGRSFTERFGSFSNQNEFENLDRLLIYMTPRLQQETQTFITTQSAKQSSADPYYGVTTDVVSINIDSLEEKKAVVLVDTRRRESKEGEPTSIFSQRTRIVILKQAGEWLVDKFDWQ